MLRFCCEFSVVTHSFYTRTPTFKYHVNSHVIQFIAIFPTLRTRPQTGSCLQFCPGLVRIHHHHLSKDNHFTAHMTTETVKVESVEAQYIDNEKIINEEFKIWKKTVPLLYDTIQTYALESPSLTVQSIPGFELSQDTNELETKFLLGTYSTTGDNFLKYVTARLPSTLSPKTTHSIPIPSGGGDFTSKLSLKQRWLHPGEVNKARIHRDKVATFTKTGDVKIWSFDKSECVKTLKYHQKDGFGLEWNLLGSKLVTGGEDTHIALWDLSSETPLRVYKQHSAIVNDFSWSYGIPTMFGSVSDDLSIKFFDTRSDEVLINVAEAHKDVINAIDFNPKQTNLFVTGGADNLVTLWDLRNTKMPLRQLYGHNGAVNQVKINPDESHLLASSSNDRRIHVWDLLKLEEEFDVDDFTKNDKEDPCLKFIHGGHVSKVNEFDWVSGVSNTIVSVGEDALLEIWKPHFEEEDEEEEGEAKEEKNEEQASTKDAEGDEKME